MSHLTELRKKALEKEFSRMNGRQREAVFCTEGPLLVLAGAGSGKTTVLVNRIANIIRYGSAYHSEEEGSLTPADAAAMEAYADGEAPLPEDTRARMAQDPCRPWQVLAITFTNKAAGELKNRLIAMLGEEGGEIWASTFHSTCARILRQFGDRLGYTSHFTIYDTDDSRRLMKECLRTLGIEEKVLSHKAVLNEISRAKDSLVSPEEFLQAAGRDNRLALIGQAYKLYQAKLRSADAMDFDDLISLTVHLFQECPDVLEHFQRKFRYIMVDEYQDTNHAQYMLVELLSRRHRNLCVVGDDDQSIYKFRGATIENIMSFEKTFPHARLIRLEQNYRSTQNILDAANAVISNNLERKGKTLWTENPRGRKIALYTAVNETGEAEYITKQILEGAVSRKFSDYAVLYRMNSQSSTLERMFVKSGVPYRMLGGLRFYERKEIRDMIAYLSVVNNPEDEIRLRRIINQPRRSIGEKTIAQAAEIAAGLGQSMFEVISHADEFEPLKRSAAKLLPFAALIQELQKASETMAPSDLYQLLLEKTGYPQYLRETEEETAQDRIDNMNELLSNLRQYEQDNGEEATLSGFLEEVALMTDVDNLDESVDAVVMMTMHSAKGLEFPCVFLPGFEEGVFPGMQAIYNPQEIEEERRLAYVAITRAREELTIVNAESRMLFGSTNRNKPSRFCLEIPEELVDRARARDWKKPEPGTVLPVSYRETRAAAFQSARSFGPAAVARAEKPAAAFRPGDAVLHKTFGEGMVISASPMGNDTLLEVAFERVGTKKIMANYARLQKL